MTLGLTSKQTVTQLLNDVVLLLELLKYKNMVTNLYIIYSLSTNIHSNKINHEIYLRPSIKPTLCSVDYDVEQEEL